MSTGNPRLDTDITAALQSGATARERLDAFLALDPRGRRGAPALRERQELVSQRLGQLSRAQHDREFARPPAERPWKLAFEPTSAAEYQARASRGRKVAYEQRLEVARIAKRRKVADRLTRRFRPTIAARGGETDIEGQYEIQHVYATDWRGSCGRETVVLHAAGWRQYSRAYGARRASLSYLCGVDDSGPWAVRIPGTITTLDAAVAFVEPADVRQAREQGRRVHRQGDVYAVETPSRCDGSGADELDRHEWYERARVLLHPEHAPLRIDHPVRFVRQRVLQMGRGAGRSGGD